MTPTYVLGAAVCLLVLWAWTYTRLTDARRRITGCAHENTYVSQSHPHYGAALTFKCQDCGWQTPIRELHVQPRTRFALYRYVPPGQDP